MVRCEKGHLLSKTIFTDMFSMVYIKQNDCYSTFVSTSSLALDTDSIAPAVKREPINIMELFREYPDLANEDRSKVENFEASNCESK